MKQKILVCENVKFYSDKDREAFCDWLKRITCIKKIELSEGNFYLHLSQRVPTYTELDNIIAIFRRYRLGMKQISEEIALYEKIFNSYKGLKEPKNAKK